MVRRQRQVETGDDWSSTSGCDAARPRHWTIILAAVLIGGIVLAVYWPALSAKAYFIDDDYYLTDNPQVQNPSWRSAGQIFGEMLEPSRVVGYYQPLSIVTLMIDHAMGGRANYLRPFHRTSLALHVANTLLLFGLLYGLFGRLWIAAVLSLLFRLHPMTVEPIVWTGERKTPLAAFFSLLCLLAYVRYAKKNSWAAYAACLLAYVLALLSKPTATPLPALLLVLDYWPLGRLGRRALLEKVPLFVVGAASAVVTMVSCARTGGVGMPGDQSLTSMVLTACHNAVFYIRTMAWPAGLTSVYPPVEPLSLSNPVILFSVAAIAGLALALPLIARWNRAPLAGGLFYLLALAPTLGFVRWSWVGISDKHAYLPAVGLILCAAGLMCGIERRVRRLTRPAWVCGVGAIAVLALAVAEARATRAQIDRWQDTESLYRYMLTLAPNSPELHNNLGIVLAQRGWVDEGIALCSQALTLRPAYPKAHYNLGVALGMKGDAAGAAHHYAEAIKDAPALPAALNNLAWLQAAGADEQLHDPDSAVKLAEEACNRTGYRMPDYLDTLAVAYAAAGRFEEAKRTAEQAAQLAENASLRSLAAEIRGRVRFYESRQAFREPATTTGWPAMK